MDGIRPLLRSLWRLLRLLLQMSLCRGLGTTMYSLAYGRMGDDAVAAITITTTIQDIAVVLFQSLSAATAVILGNELVQVS